MATASPPAGQPAAERVPFGVRLHRFWRRVTEGLEVSQLWSQFESEARTSYRLYSRDVEAKTPEGLTRRGAPPTSRSRRISCGHFWRSSPPRPASCCSLP